LGAWRCQNASSREGLGDVATRLSYAAALVSLFAVFSAPELNLVALRAQSKIRALLAKSWCPPIFITPPSLSPLSDYKLAGFSHKEVIPLPDCETQELDA